MSYSTHAAYFALAKWASGSRHTKAEVKAARDYVRHRTGRPAVNNAQAWAWIKAEWEREIDAL